MSNNNKKIVQEASRWLRIGFLTISVLRPVINTLSSRLRDRSTTLREKAAKSSTVVSQSQERLTTAGTSLAAESLNTLKEQPYSKGLLERGSRLAEDLVDRGSKLSHVVSGRGEQVGRDLAESGSKATQGVVDRGSDVLQELAERSEKASQELAKRGEQVSKEITKRGAKISKEVTKRSRKAAREVTKRSQKAQRELAKRTEQLTQQNSRPNTPFWAVFSFSMGLTAAGVATYLLIRKRLQQNEQDSQQAHVSLNGSLNGSSKNTTSTETRSISQPSLATKTPEASTLTEPATTASIVAEPKLDDESATEKLPSISTQGAIKTQSVTEETPVQAATTAPEYVAPSDAQTETATTEQNTPTAHIKDAAFLGVVGTKHYYPVETPLNELHSAGDAALDVIYFTTEDEAKAQGYTLAG